MRSPTGRSTEVVKSTNQYIGNGGSPDGAIQISPEKLVFEPITRNPMGQPFQPGNELVISIIPTAGVTLDISDALAIIPLTDAITGQVSTIGLDDMTAVGDIAIGAGVKTELATYTIPQGKQVYFGGGKIFLSIEDNTA